MGLEAATASIDTTSFSQNAQDVMLFLEIWEMAPKSEVCVYVCV